MKKQEKTFHRTKIRICCLVKFLLEHIFRTLNWDNNGFTIYIFLEEVQLMAKSNHLQKKLSDFNNSYQKQKLTKEIKCTVEQCCWTKFFDYFQGFILKFE